MLAGPRALEREVLVYPEALGVPGSALRRQRREPWEASPHRRKAREHSARASLRSEPILEGMADGPEGMADEPGGMADVPGGMADVPGGMANEPGGMANE